MRLLQLTVAVIVLCVQSALAMPKAKVFIKNDGRWPSNVLYVAPSTNGMVFITTTGMKIDARTSNGANETYRTLVSYDVIGSRGSYSVQEQRNPSTPTVTVVGPMHRNSSMETFSEVIVRHVLPGIHLEYVWEGDAVRYNVIAEANVGIPQNLFQVSGAEALTANRHGISTLLPTGSVTMTNIASFHKGSTEQLKTQWKAAGDRFGFNVKDRVNSQPLIIDPVVNILSFGGNAQDHISGMKRKADGSYVIAGWTKSTSFDDLPEGTSVPTIAGIDSWVALVSSDLETVTHITFITGSKDDKILDVALDSKEQVCLTGETTSPDYPKKGTSINQTFGGGKDAFITVLSADLKQHIMGMFLPGNMDDVGNAIAVTTNDNIVVVGQTNSPTGIRAAVNFDDTLRGLTDGFIYMLNPSYLYAEFFTFVGGTGADGFHRVALDRNNNIIACGTSTSADYYIYPRKVLIPDGYDEYTGEPKYRESGRDPYSPLNSGGATDIVISKFNTSGQPVFSTYFGGDGADEVTGVFIDAEDAIFFGGNTTSTNLPVGLAAPYQGQTDGFIAQLSADGFRISGASYIGGSRNDMIYGIVRQGPGVAAVTGITESSAFPVVGSGTIGTSGSAVNAFLTVSSLSSISYSTMLGAQGLLTPTCIVTDIYGDATIGGDFQPLAQPQAGEASNDIYLTKWAFGTLNYQSPNPGESLCAGSNAVIRWITEELDLNVPMFVDFSTDNGATWTQVGADIKARVFTYTIPADISLSSQCKFRVRTNRGHHAETPGILSVIIPPSVTEQPDPVVSCVGSSVTISAEVNGTNLSIQWRKNGQDIAGATSASYSIATADAGHSGDYDVVITNGCGSVTSSVARVDITDKPLIDQHPASASSQPGATVTLKVVARGPNLKYQWKKDGSDISGATNSELQLSNLSGNDAGVYVCVVTSDCGTATTNEATVIVLGTSVQETAWAANATIQVRPNPAVSGSVILLPPTQRTTTLTIFSLDGARLFSTIVPASESIQSLPLDINSLPSGTYRVQLNGSVSTLGTTFIVNR